MKNLVGLLLAVVLAAGAATLVTPHPSAATLILADYSGATLLAVPGFFFPFVVLLFLGIWPYVLRWHQPGIVAESFEFPT